MAVETREASPAHLLVKIESFSLLDMCGVDKYVTREFDAGNYKWTLVIYPDGHGTEKAGEYVSVYLAISGTDSLPKNWEVNAVFSIFILNQISEKYVYTPGKTRRFFSLKTEWGFSNFISKKDLTTPSNGYLIDDSCLFGAEVFINDNRVVSECLSLKNVIVPYKHAFKISDISKLKDICCSEEFTAGGYKWKITLYPNGSEVDNKLKLSVYVTYVASDPCDERVKARFTVCLKNQLYSPKKRRYTGSNWFDASKSTWGWDSFISKAQLKAAICGFVVNDTCLLEVEISVQAVAAQ